MRKTIMIVHWWRVLAVTAIASGLAGAGAVLFGLRSGERKHGAVRRRIRDALDRGREAQADAAVERAAILTHIERRRNRMSLEASRQDYP